jgi:large subunit ribosomal protein L10
MGGYSALAISKKKKQELVADYEEKLRRSQAVILTDYQGLDVAQIGQLRSRLRGVGTGYHVIKNSLLCLALEEAELPELTSLLDGPTAIGFCYEDAQPAARVLVDFASEGNTLALKGGLLGERVLASDDVSRLASLPPQEVLISQLLAALQSPLAGLLNVLSGPMRGLATVLNARVDQLQSAES